MMNDIIIFIWKCEVNSAQIFLLWHHMIWLSKTEPGGYGLTKNHKLKGGRKFTAPII